jgi:hypothetical protein
MGKDKQGGEVPSQFKSREILWTSKSEHMTLVHFLIGRRGNVILSVAKNLSERPFVALRVTTLVCQSFVVRFRAIYKQMGSPSRSCFDFAALRSA